MLGVKDHASLPLNIAEKDMVMGVRIEIVGLRMLWLGTGVDYGCI